MPTARKDVLRGRCSQATRRQFTADEYQRMAASGILSEDDRVELLQGEIVHLCPVGSRHVACVNRLTQAFSGRLANRVIVSVRNAIRLGDYSEPEPDLALLRRRDDFYVDALPVAKDVSLIVEVMQSSTESDREVKRPLYAHTRARSVARGPGAGAHRGVPSSRGGRVRGGDAVRTGQSGDARGVPGVAAGRGGDMRTIVDLHEEQVEVLGRIFEEDKIFRAEAIRRAIDAYSKQRQPSIHSVFGLWRNRKGDSLEHEDRLRDEWG